MKICDDWKWLEKIVQKFAIYVEFTYLSIFHNINEYFKQRNKQNIQWNSIIFKNKLEIKKNNLPQLNEWY